jgi:natural product biosynthesis luciferase-like monooxygenase protein
VELSLFFFAAGGESDDPAKYRLLLDAARLGDQADFTAVWTPERHFGDFGGLYPNPSVTGAALATVTERLDIRAGSVVLPLHNPIRVAEEWAVVDNLSGGRAGVSFASGWHRNDFVLSPDNYETRRERNAVDVATVRALWRGEECRLPGVDGEPVTVRTLPRPVQPELPVWITSAESLGSTRFAGDIGAHLLTHLLGQGREQLAAKIAVYREHVRAATGSAGHVTLMLHTYVTPADGRVDERVRRRFEEYVHSSMVLTATAGGEGLELQGLTSDDLAAIVENATERHMGNALIGTPEQVLRTAREFAALGVDEIACLIDFGLPYADTMAGIERLADVGRQLSAAALT